MKSENPRSDGLPQENGVNQSVILSLDLLVLWRKAAEDSRVSVTQITGPGEKYIVPGRIRTLPNNLTMVRFSGEFANMTRFHRRKRELEEMLAGKRKVPSSLRAIMEEARSKTQRRTP